MALNTLESLVNSACFLAGKEGINTAVISQLLVPIVFQTVTRKFALDESTRPYTLGALTVSFTNGVADLPQAVLVEGLKWAVLENAGDATQTQKYTFVSWQEFSRPLTPTSLQLGFYAVTTEMTADRSPLIYVVEPGDTYVPGAGFTGNLILTSPVVPAVPAAAGDPVDATMELQQEFLLELARMIKQGVEVAA